jgi:hypothetical protein
VEDKIQTNPGQLKAGSQPPTVPWPSGNLHLSADHTEIKEMNISPSSGTAIKPYENKTQSYLFHFHL